MIHFAIDPYKISMIIEIHFVGYTLKFSHQCMLILFNFKTFHTEFVCTAIKEDPILSDASVIPMSDICTVAMLLMVEHLKIQG